MEPKTRTCGRKIEGIRCGRPTNSPAQPYCREHMREYQRKTDRRRREGESCKSYGQRDRAILDTALRQHTERIRRHEDEWDVEPLFNQETLELIAAQRQGERT